MRSRIFALLFGYENIKEIPNSFTMPNGNLPNRIAIVYGLGCFIMKPKYDLTGRAFGRLIVIGLSHKDKKGYYHWLCQCDCGMKSTPVTASLLGGKTLSCGNHHVENMTKAKIKHGDAAKGKTHEYMIWKNIKRRCYNINSQAYKDYGGRGIIMSDEWKNDYSKFLSDMGRKPSPKHTIDRIDNNKGYCKENCEWATMKEQSNNRRDNRKFTFKGETLTLAIWSERFKINYMTLYRRVVQNGWSIENALNTKPLEFNKLIEFNGSKLSLRGWAEKTNIHYEALRSRIKLGWSMEKTLTTPSKK